jgi:hypothetical protein
MHTMTDETTEVDARFDLVVGDLEQDITEQEVLQMATIPATCAAIYCC